MLIALDFTILRGLESNGRVPYPLVRPPKMVATVINEALFEQTGNSIHHGKTVLLEDQMHDWSWSNGQLRYFARNSGLVDVLVAFEVTEVFFCTQCGTKNPSLAGDCSSCGYAPGA
jgi:hypothetical protein